MSCRKQAMQILVARHVPFEHLGRFATLLEARGVGYTYLDLFNGAQFPRDQDSYAGLISMGGPMSANDNLPFIVRELSFIEEALSRGKPVLGICLGSQLLARAASARVYRNPVKEIGWAPVCWTAAARHDRLFGGFVQSKMVFHWHGETFDLPKGAQWLAWSAACRHQAFRLGQAYGLQFHLEVTPEMVFDWLSQEANCDDVRELTETIDPAAHTGTLERLATTVFGRWCELVRSSADGNRRWEP